MTNDGGGWTVIQRRADGSVDFNRDWRAYRDGFGDIKGEYWLGNGHVYRLTNQRVYKLRIVMTDWAGEERFLEYQTFRIEDEKDSFRARIGQAISNVVPSGHFIMPNEEFTTKDVDHDSYSGNCADSHSGGGWYTNCGVSGNVNGRYYRPGEVNTINAATGIFWYHWHGMQYSMKSAVMKIRPADFEWEMATNHEN
eukprot:XP_002590477.1 hypothetical protein BRAFLDRAFT_86147 [Branchiostoma floridae]